MILYYTVLGRLFWLFKTYLITFLLIKRLVIIDLSKSASEAAHSMVKNKCGALLVCDSSKNDILVGIVSERDLAFRVIPKNLDPKNTKISKIMTKNVKLYHQKKPRLMQFIMKSKGFRHLPVVENKKLLVFSL